MSYIAVVLSQFEAALAMHGRCIDACPDEHWDSPIAKYPFWMVSYHTLCYVDCYMSRTNEEWSAHPVFHPAGRAELEEEYPSRRFTREELREYLKFGLAKAREALGRESAETLAGPTGFSHLPFSRGELHLYNLRHVAHHTGQMTAFLRRAGVETNWVKAGWR